MREIRGNLFTVKADAICIPVDGSVVIEETELLGKAVKIAKHVFRSEVGIQAQALWPDLSELVGWWISRCGAVPGIVKVVSGPKVILPFFTKPAGFTARDRVLPAFRDTKISGGYYPGYFSCGDLKLMEENAAVLTMLVDTYGWKTVAIPRFGCGTGKMQWEGQMRDFLHTIFPPQTDEDDRFLLVEWDGSVVTNL